MTARVTPMPGGRVGVIAPMATWHAAGRYLDFPALPVERAMACDNHEAAMRLAHYVNAQLAIHKARQAANPVRQLAAAE